jgi:hypothetical protein
MAYSPVADNIFWYLYLLGYSKENVRKAYLVNSLTGQRLDAKVSETKNKNQTSYKVIEAVDPKKNIIVDFTADFVVKQR